MLSFYDSLAFAMHKRSFTVGFLLLAVTVLSLLGVGTAVCYLSDVSAFDFIRSDMSVVQKPVRTLLTFLGNPDLIFRFKRISLGLVSGWFLTVLIFLCLFLICARRVLLHQAGHIPTWFFFKSVGVFLVLTLPISGTLFYFLDRQSNLEISKILYLPSLPNIQLAGYSAPFFGILGAVLFLYFWTVAPLFCMYFRVRDLLNLRAFFRHFGAFLELVIKSLFVILGAVALAIGLCFWVKAFKFPAGGFFFLFAYASLLLFFKGWARFWILLPVVLDTGIMTYIGFTKGLATMQSLLWTVTLLVVLIFVCFYLFAMVWAALAHLVVQTAYVYVFNRSPARDVMTAQPEVKKVKFEPVYQQFMRASESQDHTTGRNYFSRQMAKNEKFEGALGKEEKDDGLYRPQSNYFNRQMEQYGIMTGNLTGNEDLPENDSKHKKKKRK